MGKRRGTNQSIFEQAQDIVRKTHVSFTIKQFKNRMAAARRKWESTIQEEPNDFVRGKYQESRQSKITRVNKLYTDFLELSKIEKINFINLIKNYG